MCAAADVPATLSKRRMLLLLQRQHGGLLHTALRLACAVVAACHNLQQLLELSVHLLVLMCYAITLLLLHGVCSVAVLVQQASCRQHQSMLLSQGQA
jgi:hypothetical protein